MQETVTRHTDTLRNRARFTGVHREIDLPGGTTLTNRQAIVGAGVALVVFIFILAGGRDEPPEVTIT